MGLKPGIDQLLIATAIDAELRRQLEESPEEAFQGFDLKEEEKDLLRHPDHRLLRLLGAALARERESSAFQAQGDSEVSQQPHAVIEGATLPEVSLVLTLVPCAKYEDGRLDKINYAVWVKPLPAGTDPASLQTPPEMVFPGQPLTPLHAVIQVSALRMQDMNGNPLIGLSAVFRKSSNLSAPPPPGSDLDAPEIQAAIAGVRRATTEQKYDRLIDLLHSLHLGEGR
jgi:hypothetical protein